ncbi:hypothetical protein [Streptomyces broussonetiae]|uniref:LPXTG cell wall anchor domain-containing protein n=1 Tax=Streptomyces broussonetiae TaxID=2686304 RepID=A0ABV5E462_9ACTN
MRHTARVLSVVAFAGTALTCAIPAVSAEPTAEVSPATVRPGGTVTVTVSCDPIGGPAPGTIDATSQAFEEGTVKLRALPVTLDTRTGPAYEGTAKIAPAGNFEGGPGAVGPDSAWTVDGTCPAPPGGQGKPWSATFTVTHGGGGPTHTPRPCPSPRHHDSGASCPGTGVQHGVHAGEGGTFTDSVPALVTGGLLVTGALGAAVYRVRRKEPTADA